MSDPRYVVYRPTRCGSARGPVTDACITIIKDLVGLIPPSQAAREEPAWQSRYQPYSWQRFSRSGRRVAGCVMPGRAVRRADLLQVQQPLVTGLALLAASPHIV